jgi:hypothetical protein
MKVVIPLPKKIVYLIPLLYHFKEKLRSCIVVYDEREAGVAEDFVKAVTYLNKRYKLSIDYTLLQIDEDAPLQMEVENLFLSDGVDATLVHELATLAKEQKGVIYSYDKRENSFNKIQGTKITNHYALGMGVEDYFSMLGYVIDYRIPTIRNKNLAEAKFRNFRKFFNKIRNIQNSTPQVRNLFSNLFEEFIYWKLFALQSDDILLGVKAQKDGIHNFY